MGGLVPCLAFSFITWISLFHSRRCAHCTGVAGIMAITSIRDGMNLVAYEYVACQQAHDGVLILSEFAGAAQSLGTGALQVNPWNITEIADAIHRAITMQKKEKRERMEYLFNHVMAHTTRTWAREFVNVLEAPTHTCTQ